MAKSKIHAHIKLVLIHVRCACCKLVITAYSDMIKKITSIIFQPIGLSAQQRSVHVFAAKTKGVAKQCIMHRLELIMPMASEFRRDCNTEFK